MISSLPDGKIDIHNVKRHYETIIDNLKEDDKIIKENKKLIFDFIRDCTLGKTVKNKERKKIGLARCSKYAIDLRRISSWLDKSFKLVLQSDMEKFITSLENDKLKKLNGENFSENTKVDLKKTIKKFYKWLLGNNERYPDIVSWIDTYSEVKEIRALTREEIEKMADRTISLRDKIIIMMLFDSGARIEEFLNLRLRNIMKKEDYYMIRIEHSKTKPRTISVPMCTKLIEEWLSVHPDKNNQNAQFMPIAYDNLRMMLRRLGERVLKKSVNPHLFRHSSATYYCNKLSQFQLCYRYGWAMSSKEPARYIDREGIHEQETAKIIKNDEISSVQKKNQEMNEELSRLKSQYGQMENVMQKINDFMSVLSKNKDFRKIVSSEGQVKKLLDM